MDTSRLPTGPNYTEEDVHEFVSGELVQLWPVPKHEQPIADTWKSAEKRFIYSQKEAAKQAKRMIAAARRVVTRAAPC